MMRSADPSKLSLRERELSLREGRGTRERMFGNCLTGAADEERNLLMEAMASSACSSKQSPRDTDPVGWKKGRNLISVIRNNESHRTEVKIR